MESQICGLLTPSQPTEKDGGDRAQDAVPNIIKVKLRNHVS